jgi:hypothetical protein
VIEAVELLERPAVVPDDAGEEQPFAFVGS